jgi:hypothetical protein
MEKIIERINPILRGWFGYYKHAYKGQHQQYDKGGYDLPGGRKKEPGFRGGANACFTSGGSVLVSSSLTLIPA